MPGMGVAWHRLMGEELLLCSYEVTTVTPDVILKVQTVSYKSY